MTKLILAISLTLTCLAVKVPQPIKAEGICIGCR